MIDDSLSEAFNSRIRVDLNSIKKMTPAQLDRVKTYGSTAENLLLNKDFAQFVHHFKFELLDQLSSITGHADEDNTRRIAISNQLAGVDGFIAWLQRAKYFKDKAVSQQTQSLQDPA